ncbi:uncharacterized protein LOC130623285 [Hydractinia symbiolongicarpus]|uniref:uncharacterized protein LOC130623285 n=1 Tax=Hydractinia symbiolongicarpus TaxID=13093 RepID=UPI00254A0103|nr:uncharacterized protein LOC130623285 [Hydractinia symbiolongicarpus]
MSNCGGHRSIMAEERLPLTLRFLATRGSFQLLHFQFRISLNAVSYTIKGCCKALVDKLVAKCLQLPSSEKEWLQISEKFETRWNYPHALGAMDGKHITIKKPANYGSYYYNYKHNHSIILLAIAGPEYECLYADIGSNGRVSDSGVWSHSSLLQSIKDGSLNLTENKRIYNYRHSRARRISENLLGILANRWRVFFTTINLEPKHVENIVLSALALHNMFIKKSAYRTVNLADSILDNGDIREGEWRRHFIPSKCLKVVTMHLLQLKQS